MMECSRGKGLPNSFRVSALGQCAVQIGTHSHRQRSSDWQCHIDARKLRAPVDQWIAVPEAEKPTPVHSDFYAKLLGAFQRTYQALEPIYAELAGL